MKSVVKKIKRVKDEADSKKTFVAASENNRIAWEEAERQLTPVRREVGWEVRSHIEDQITEQIRRDTLQAFPVGIHFMGMFCDIVLLGVIGLAFYASPALGIIVALMLFGSEKKHFGEIFAAWKPKKFKKLNNHWQRMTFMSKMKRGAIVNWK